MSEVTLTKTLGCAQTRRRHGAMRLVEVEARGRGVGDGADEGWPEVALACGDAVFDRAADYHLEGHVAMARRRGRRPGLGASSTGGGHDKEAEVGASTRVRR